MRSSERDFSLAVASALVLAAVVLLVVLLRVPGLILSLLLVAGVLIVGRRFQTNPEIEAMTASLLLTRDDICDVLGAYDQLQHGASAADLADRTLHFPALAKPDHTVPEINEFLLRASSARRFLARIDAHLDNPSTDKAQLKRLLMVADERAFELQAAWDDARRAACELGPS